MRDVYLFLFCLPDMSSRLGCRSRGSWVGEQRPGTAARQVERLRPAKVTQPSLVPRGAAVRASRQTPLVELDTRQRRRRARADTGCRVLQHLSYLWTRAHLYYLTKRRQETTGLRRKRRR